VRVFVEVVELDESGDELAVEQVVRAVDHSHAPVSVVLRVGAVASFFACDNSAVNAGRGKKQLTVTCFFPTPNLRCRSRKSWGVQKIFAQISPNLPESSRSLSKYSLPHRSRTPSFGITSKKGLHVILHTLGTNSARIRR